MKKDKGSMSIKYSSWGLGLFPVHFYLYSGVFLLRQEHSAIAGREKWTHSESYSLLSHSQLVTPITSYRCHAHSSKDNSNKPCKRAEVSNAVT